MNIKASGRSALIVAAGLWLGLAGPMRATDSAAEPEPAGQAAQTEKAGTPVKHGEYTKHRSHKRHVAHTRKSSKTASKADGQVDKTASAAQDSDKQLSLPPTVADANAEMPGATADAPKTHAGAFASSAGKMLASNNQEDYSAPQADTATSTAAATEVVPSDQLNEVDRALTDNKQAAPVLAMASLDTPASASSADTTVGQAAASEDSWNQASLIGKIFIAFGGLLTFASAARMFMA